MNIKLTEHNLKFLSLKGGCTVSSESTLVKMPHCWKSHVTAHIFKMQSLYNISRYNMDLDITQSIVASNFFYPWNFTKPRGVVDKRYAL